jgi:hypothetical protein
VGGHLGGSTDGGLVRALEGVHTNCAVEEGSSEEIGVARTPVDLERPVLRTGKLAECITCLGVPAKGAVVFAAGQEEVRVLGTP